MSCSSCSCSCSSCCCSCGCGGGGGCSRGRGSSSEDDVERVGDGDAGGGERDAEEEEEDQLHDGCSVAGDLVPEYMDWCRVSPYIGRCHLYLVLFMNDNFLTMQVHCVTFWNTASTFAVLFQVIYDH